MSAGLPRLSVSELWALFPEALAVFVASALARLVRLLQGMAPGNCHGSTGSLARRFSEVTPIVSRK